MDTQHWIKSKIEEFSAPGNRYEIKFQAGLMQYDFDGSTSAVKNIDFGSINIKEIHYISFTQYSQTVWMTVHLKEGFEPAFNFSHSGMLAKNGKFPFVLRKSFNDEDLPGRMRKAMFSLVEMNGGQMLLDKEPY